MALPTPDPGLVISYAYLWEQESQQGLVEGRKTRPCVLILAVEAHMGSTRVTVAPITHRPPTDKTSAIEIPARIKQHLGLDDAASWVVISEVNQFIWPGYDLRPIAGHSDKYAYGFLPPHLFEKLRSTLVERVHHQRIVTVERD